MPVILREPKMETVWWFLIINIILRIKFCDFCIFCFSMSLPIGRFSHKVDMFVCVSCKTPTYGCCEDLWSKNVVLILACDHTIFQKKKCISFFLSQDFRKNTSVCRWNFMLKNVFQIFLKPAVSSATSLPPFFWPPPKKI